MEQAYIYPWQEFELSFTSENDYSNPYCEIDMEVEFQHENGEIVIRPAFWIGGKKWKVRFAAPGLVGNWAWKSSCNVQDSGLDNRSGSLLCVSDGSESQNCFHKHGFWKMSANHRSVIHADGTSVILAVDTAWALPWRATEEQCRIYAEDRHNKGFNAVMLMSVQPDMRARGPQARTVDGGFDVGFLDLPSGHITKLNPDYFNYLDKLINILVKNEITPIYQPVFFGFGWKGLEVAGPVLPAEEYARYCKYLVGRYGARPAIYLVGADGSGLEPQIPAGGKAVEKWDSYHQPTGIHYRPHAVASAWQDQEWLDFQWCQTGHLGEHIPERVADMWRNLPKKGVANGEPSYERTGRSDVAVGWWQGHEAWSNLCAGGTMGVFYGAASLWQWRYHSNEPGHASYFLAEEAGWREALDFEGSKYIGLVRKILEGLPTTDMEPDWQVSLGRRGLLVKDLLYIAYLENGGRLEIVNGEHIPKHYRVYNPKNGSIVSEGVRAYESQWFVPDLGGEPRVYIFYDGWK